MLKTFLALSILFLIACNKDSSGINDHIYPVIVLQTPVDGQVMTAGQAFHISGSITDDQYISQAHVHVNNNTSGAELMDVHLFPNGNSTTFDQTFTPAAATSYKVTIMATDKATNLSTTSVVVSCN